MERVRFGDGNRSPVRRSGRQPTEAGAALPTPEEESASFSRQLGQARLSGAQAQLEKLLADIAAEGERLARSFSLADLRRYKAMVRSFMQEVLDNGLSLRRELNMDPYSFEQRTLVTVRSVNQELDDLARMVLDREKDHLAILAKIGEIKGLLMDMRI